MNRVQMIKRIMAVTNGFRTRAEEQEVDGDTQRANRMARKILAHPNGEELAAILQEETRVNVVAAFRKLKNPIGKAIMPLVCFKVGSTLKVSLVPGYLVDNYTFLNQDGSVTLYDDENVNTFNLATDVEIQQLTEVQVNYLIDKYTA